MTQWPKIRGTSIATDAKPYWPMLARKFCISIGELTGKKIFSEDSGPI